MQSALFKPMGKKRALLIAIRSVPDPELSNLDFAHRDAKELYRHLIYFYDYQPDDIILMLDDKHHPKELWPTHKKILHQIDQLTHDAPEDCRFFFYYSGHGLEEECSERASMRADGREEEIVCADGKPILDYILHNRLITPLEKVKGSKLFALFDCCHSETLLDLQMGRGPNNYSRAWTMGRDQLFRCVSSVIAKVVRLYKRHRQSNGPAVPRRKSTDWVNESASETREVGKPSVICLSACRDWQSAHDDCERKLTFTKFFLDAMAERPNVSWGELRDTLTGLISQIQERFEPTCWTQEPRLSTNSFTDLRQTVFDFLCEHCGGSHAVDAGTPSESEGTNDNPRCAMCG